MRDDYVFRKAAFLVFAFAGSMILIVSLPILAAHHVHDLLTGAIGFSAFVYLFWLLGWHSAVRLGRNGIVVDNLLVRHVIPWDPLESIGVSYGLVIRLRDGMKICPLMYGGSVLGQVLGYRYTRKVAARMNAVKEELQARVPQAEPAARYQRRSGFSPWPPLVIVAIMEAIAGLSMLLVSI